MSIYGYALTDIQGHSVPLSNYEGQVLLIVNTATQCGLTPQLEGLEQLHDRYKARGFAVLGLPCNQFLNQAPESDEQIAAFCRLKYGTSFPSFKKVEVNGDGADPLYAYLKRQKPDDLENGDAKAFHQKLLDMKLWNEGSDIHWNFTKFLIGRDGEVAERFSPGYTAEALAPHIEALL